MQDFRPHAKDFNEAYNLWQQAAKRALRGADPDILVHKTIDGLLRGPLMTCNDHDNNTGTPGEFPFVRGLKRQLDPNRPWDIRSEVWLDAPQTCNSQILEELTGGASSIQLQAGPEPILGDELGTILNGVEFNLAGIGVSCDDGGPDTALALRDLWMDMQVDPSQIHGDFGLQLSDNEGHNQDIIKLCHWAAQYAPNIRSLTIAPCYIHEAGGSEALELAWMCAQGAQYMRVLLETGLTANKAADQMQSLFSMDADLHLGIAKLRAARRLWAKMLNSFGVDPGHCGLHIHGRSSRRMMSRLDPWVNILRTSTATLASVLGGAQTVSVLPFTYRLGTASDMAKRLARNTQLILAEECFAGRVIDPAGGSHVHETMSNQLAQAGWKIFQQIEAKNGLQNAREWLAGRVREMRELRTQQIRTQERVLIGVNAFADLNETAPKIAKTNQLTEENPYFLQSYDSAEFEQLRDLARQLPATPTAFLASIGTVASNSARASFARRFLASGGIACSEAKNWQGNSAMLADFDADFTPLVIICGSDEQYQENTDELVAMFKAKGAKQVWITGDTKNEALDGCIFAGCDMIATLKILLSCFRGRQ